MSNLTFDPNAIVTVHYKGKTPTKLYEYNGFDSVQVMPNSKAPIHAKFLKNETSPDFRCLHYKSNAENHNMKIPVGMAFKHFVKKTFKG